ncbi:MAG: nucleotidyl transferase AbiEii/AbiGii toxin family protein, partial [Verrucomicrobia bacterium]|nr:nucleotidyl transferase AbiEii/AbiGii toxin family protein [Verrucomicrobiota bacterium]
MLTSREVTSTEIFDAVVSAGSNTFLEVIDCLEQGSITYAVIGGLAINTYVEPVYTADADFVIGAADLTRAQSLLQARGFQTEAFEFSVNFAKPGSGLSVKVTIDPAYQDMIERAQRRPIFGREVFVASLPDLIRGKIMAWSDESGRASKRAKDEADLLRIGETYPQTRSDLPEPLQSRL